MRPPPVTIRVCDSLSCAMAGAEHLLRELPSRLGRDTRVVRAPCMGACDRAPVCAVGHAQVMQATTESVAAAAAHASHPHPYPTPVAYDVYVRDGGYALLKACTDGTRTRDDITTLDEFREFFSGEDTDSGGFVKAPWSEESETLETMGELGVSVRIIPFDTELPPDARCVITGGPARAMAIFAKAY